MKVPGIVKCDSSAPGQSKTLGSNAYGPGIFVDQTLGDFRGNGKGRNWMLHNTVILANGTFQF